MTLSRKPVTRHLVLSLSTLFLMLFLAACNLPGSSSASSTPTAAPATPTSTPTPATTFQAYSDSNFAVNYPTGWTAKPSNGTVAFSDSLQIYNFTVAVTPDPGSAVSADQVADAGISGAKTNLKNTQAVSVPATAMVDGKTWSQRAVSGTATQNGQSVDVELVVLTYVANDKSYLIVYGTLKQTFDMSTATYFQPMLLSFKIK